MAKLKRGNPNKPKKGGGLKEAMVTPKDPMYYYNLSFEKLKSGEAYKDLGDSDEVLRETGLRDYKAFLNAEKNGYVKSGVEGWADRVSNGVWLEKFYPDEPNYAPKEKPQYVKDALANGMEIDFFLQGPESQPVYFFKKPEKTKAPIVKAKPKKIEFSVPSMKIKKPIEEKILDILNTRSGGGRRVETNYGTKDYNGNLGIKQFAEWVKNNRGKVDEYRANRR